jgi:hypothetical protein
VQWFYQPEQGTLYYTIHFLSSQIENKYDHLYFGPFNTDDRQNTCTGKCKDVAYIVSDTGLGFEFISDSTVTRQGFELVISYDYSLPKPSMHPTSISGTDMIHL